LIDRAIFAVEAAAFGAHDPGASCGDDDGSMIALAVLRRLLVGLGTLAGVAAVVFVLLRVVPGDPIAMMISPGASETDVAALRAHYGLDGGLLSQFAVWARYALRGDFWRLDLAAPRRYDLARRATAGDA
jgi:hypothetical protein